MFATFIIGLREGLEAALIVGIVAAFLRRQNRSAALRWVWIGVGVAVTICLAIGIVLEVVSQDLPQRQQEGLETVIGAVAVVMVTYMVLWMRRHSRDLKGQLEQAAGGALAEGSAMALVAMAFLAVLREGLETAVFLIAAFNASHSAGLAAGGALLGILVSVALGYGIYRGGVQINLSRFFRATGVVLVLVAAGLVVTALHTAHEAGWLQSGQDQAFDLTWLVGPGSVRSSLLTGVLGVQPKPTVIEVAGWLVYAIPVLTIVLWPPSWPTPHIPRVVFGRVLIGAGAFAVVAAVALAVFTPGEHSATTSLDKVGVDVTPSSGKASTGTASVQVTSVDGDSVTAQIAGPTGSVIRDAHLTSTGDITDVDGISARRYSGVVDADPEQSADDRPSTMSLEQLAAANGGRLPLGLGAIARDQVPVTYSDTTTFDILLDAGQPVDATQHTTTVATGDVGGKKVTLGKVAESSWKVGDQAVAAATDRLHRDRQDNSRRHTLGVTAPWTSGILGLVLAAIGVQVSRRKRPDDEVREPDLERQRAKVPSAE